MAGLSIDSGVAGLAGVLVGAVITTAKEVIASWLNRRKSAAYLVILVSSHLDNYADNCSSVVGDDGQTDEHGYTHTQEPIPEFAPLSLDVDWKSLPSSLMGAVLDLPHKTEAAKRYLGNPAFDDPPDFWQYFEERQYRFAILGLQASSLMDQLREHVGLQPRPVSDRDRDGFMQERKSEIEQKRMARSERWEAKAAMDASPPPSK